MNICLILSGSIAAYKACELASMLVKAGHAVQTVATEGALRFVGVASLEGLTDRSVYTDLWAPRESKTHISLRKWADLFVFYPATANRINQLAAGLAPDLIGATFLANNFEKPFWIAPAMNTNMLRHPATQESIARLETWGCRMIWGDPGRLACGDVGLGRLAEASQVFELIQGLETPAGGEGVKPLVPEAGRLLLTGGAMTEAVDGVRAITNSSSGRTATAIARAFLEAGWRVDYLHHRSADLGGLTGLPESQSANRLTLLPYTGFADFRDRLLGCLAEGEYQTVVHAAAVSDYHVAAVREPDDKPDVGPKSGVAGLPAKLESGKPLLVELRPNPKLLPEIRGKARGRPVIVSFKLTVGEDESDGAGRAGKIIGSGSSDLVVWNDMHLLGRSPAGAGTAKAEGSHPFVLFGKNGLVARGGDNRTLAKALLDSAQKIRSEQ